MGGLVITSIDPTVGPSSGGDLVRVVGTGFGPQVAVWFGDVPGKVESLRQEGSLFVATVRTPQHRPAVVNVTLKNVGRAGESTCVQDGYRFIRPPIASESDLTRLVRTLLRELKRSVLENTSMTVSVDYDDSFADGLDSRMTAKLPSLVLSGPRIKENRLYSTNVLEERLVMGPIGPEIERRRVPLTVDLMFTVTGASASTIELLNLLHAVTTFFACAPWVTMPRDPEQPSEGRVRWEMDPEGELRVFPVPNDKEDVRAFTSGFIVRGFDIGVGQPIDTGKIVADVSVQAGAPSEGQQQ